MLMWVALEWKGYREGQRHFAGVPLHLGCMHAVPYELEGGNDAGVIKPTDQPSEGGQTN